MRNFEKCHDIDECLLRLKSDDKLAVATSRLHVTMLNLQETIFCFDRSQNIHDYSKTFMIRNDFKMRRQFIDMFKQLITTGLISKWQKELKIHRKLSKNLLNYHSIGMKDFFSVFIPVFLIIGASVPMILFEHFVHHKVNCVRPHRRWIWLDKVIWGQRCFFLLDSGSDRRIEVGPFVPYCP